MDIFDSFDERRRGRDETCGMEELGQLFLVLFIWKMPLAVGAGRLVRVNGIYQRPFGSVVFACEDYFFVTVHDLKRYLFKNGLAHIIT